MYPPAPLLRGELQARYADNSLLHVPSTPYLRRAERSTCVAPGFALLTDPQQVFEDTRSMLASDRRSFYDPEPSMFERTLQLRPKTSLMQGEEEENFIRAMENLHPRFGWTIKAMTDRSEIFEVISQWMTDLNDALHHQKNSETDLSDINVRKLLNLLQKELETWHLIRDLYFERLYLDETTQVDMPFNDIIQDRFCVNEQPYLSVMTESDPSLKEMYRIMAWLEGNFQKNGPPDLSEKNFIYEHTFEAIKRDTLVEKPSSKSMVRHIDPDAPTREGKQLHPLDDEENTKVLRGAYYYIRSGSNEDAINYLYKSGDRVKASALSGYRYTNMNKPDPETGDMVPVGIHYGQEMAAAYRKAAKEYLPKSIRAPRPNPNVEVEGNTKRDLWKWVTWKVCESKKPSKYDRAILGAVCGHRESMLQVCHTWEDKLWTFLRASSDTILETRIRAASVPNVRKALPDAYWAQALTVAECIEKVDAMTTPEPENSAEGLLQMIQKCVMVDKMDDFVGHLQETVLAVLEMYDHPLLNGHVTRFISHLLLFLAIVDLPYSQELIDVCMDKYISVLVDVHLFQEIPYYVQKLSDDRKISNVVRHVKVDKRLSRDEIEQFLQTAHNSELDVLRIGVAVVDKMRDEDDDFSVDNLSWISCCYGIVENSPQVMYEYLKYTLYFSRKYLTLGNIEKVQQLIGQLSPENVGEVIQISEALENTLIREYVCYRLYLVAEGALSLWITAQSQKPPTDEDIMLPMNASVADKTIFEKKKKEQDVIILKWKKAVEYHLDNAIQKFLDILKFPTGWLRDCYDPMDDNEAIHVGAVRRILLRKIVNILLRLVQDKNDNRTMRDFVYVLCDDRRNILRELSPSEIGNVFKVAEQFTRNKVENIMFLPHLDRGVFFFLSTSVRPGYCCENVCFFFPLFGGLIVRSIPVCAYKNFIVLKVVPVTSMSFKNSGSCQSGGFSASALAFSASNSAMSSTLTGFPVSSLATILPCNGH
ncbi:hypothetical protein Ocin01_14918 [Orchesella cincta]|uniref:Nuclear pore complex protein n=1 Tax=Orchesella cincta TaxID=48709 RepID=A0A1D2MFK1_ORCCI|nr:hypothetical protein Ocin01_14918 [Orchesella cincta]